MVFSWHHLGVFRTRYQDEMVKTKSLIADKRSLYATTILEQCWETLSNQKMALDWDRHDSETMTQCESHLCTVSKEKEVVKVICHKAALPHTDGSIVFARCCQRPPQVTHPSFDPPEFTTQTTCRSVQPFCTAYGRSVATHAWACHFR